MSRVVPSAVFGLLVLAGASSDVAIAQTRDAVASAGGVTSAATDVQPETSAQPRRRPVRDAPAKVATAEPAARVRVSGHAGLTTFTASKSFEAVLDTSRGPTFGGGAGVLIGRHLFVDVQVSRFSADGERVFVTDDLDVFPLGIPATVSVTPVDVSAGWRFTPAPRRPGAASAARRRGLRVVPFVGGGVGVVQYRETADFAEAGDDASDSFGSYHVLGGVEIPFTRRLGASVDGLYRWVPDALGEDGVSAAYGETDLGGFTLRVRATFTF